MAPKKRRRCVYPASNPTSLPIMEALGGIVGNSKKCSSFYLDTVKGMSNPSSTEGEDHHQGIARTHRLTDGSVYFFLSHSETDSGDQGSLSVYRYGGPLDDAHIIQTHPLTVAPMTPAPPLLLNETHPSDICFLPEVDNLDAGYLFVTEEYVQRSLSIYYWEPSTGLTPLEPFPQAFPDQGPQFVFVDQVDGVYYVGVASNHWGWGALFSAKASALFPKCKKGGMNVSAFAPVASSMFPFPLLDQPCQIKLIRDSLDDWYLLAFCGDDPNGADYVDVFGVRFAPFTISARLARFHVSFNAGDTGFNSTGTHYVEPSGRLLISSSYRWSKDEGPGSSSYVSRVDEIPSS